MKKKTRKLGWMRKFGWGMGGEPFDKGNEIARIRELLPFPKARAKKERKSVYTWATKGRNGHVDQVLEVKSLSNIVKGIFKWGEK